MTAMAPLVSVVIPSRGGRERLPRLLDALAAQTVSQWEALVVLDGDIDGSAALVHSWPDPRVRSIVFPDNRGRPSALNAGHAQARGQVLVRCDDDLEPRPEFLSRHLAHHREAASPVGVIGLYQNVYPDTAYARSYGRIADQQLRQDAYQQEARFRWLYWAGNVSVMRETHERIGGYDERFREYGYEDIDYGYRLDQAGVPLLIDPELTTAHHVAAITTEIRVARAYYAAVARRKFAALRHPQFPTGRARPVGAKQRIWHGAVSALGACLNLDRSTQLARFLDRLLPVLPQSIGTRLVALVVEGTAACGARIGQLPEGRSI